MNVLPHIIRIRGPWQRTVVEDFRDESSASPVSARQVVRMPGSWHDDLGEDFRGVICYERMFHRPTGLTKSSLVRLRFTRLPGQSRIRLNNEVLGEVSWPNDSAVFDVGKRLLARNDIALQISVNRDHDDKHCESTKQGQFQGGLVGVVQLEIS